VRTPTAIGLLVLVLIILGAAVVQLGSAGGWW
jgi:hypothetical protein